jgi:hypothetical protein
MREHHHEHEQELGPAMPDRREALRASMGLVAAPLLASVPTPTYDAAAE